MASAATKVMLKSRPELHLRAMSGSMALLQLGSVMISEAHCNPCRCLGSGLLPEAILVSEAHDATRAVPI